MTGILIPQRTFLRAVLRVLDEGKLVIALMGDKRISTEDFYNSVDEILGINSNYQTFPFSKRTRWNNRTPGNGRYEGLGLIRLFGDQVHISLRSPAVNKWFKTSDEALDFLRKLKETCFTKN